MGRPQAEMHKRQVVPRFWRNEDLADLEHNSKIKNLRLTMIGLWGASDEAGIFEWRPRRLAAQLYPYYEEDRKSVEIAMESMVSNGFLLKVECDGEFFGVWPHWGSHNDFREQTTAYFRVVEAAREQFPTLFPGIKARKSRLKPAEVEVEVEVEVKSIDRLSSSNSSEEELTVEKAFAADHE